MKSSMFNIFSGQEDGAVLAFNSFMGTLVKMDRKSYDTYKEITGREYKTDELTAEMRDFIMQFHRNGFIVEDEFNELEHVKKRYENVKSALSMFKLEVVPTSDCNFACKYCYFANRSSIYMTEEVQDALVEFVKKRIENRKHLNIIWTGGEPTLAPHIVIRLSKKFVEIAQQYGISYGATIFTNGYLLNGETAKKFAEYGVKIAQFVIDGPREIHDERRPLVDSSGTFDTVMRNIRDVSAIMPVAVRINLDSTNAKADYITRLLDAFEEFGLPKTIIVELAQVLPYTTLCSDFVMKYGLDRKAFAQKLSLLFPLVHERGYDPRSDLSPTLTASPCTANSSFGISPEGDVYRCFLIMGDKRECLGNLLCKEDLVENSPNYSKWDTWSPFTRKECCKCSILPICLGGDGCPFADIAVEGHLRDGIRCSPFKFNMEEMVDLMYRKYYKRRSIENGA